MFKENTVFILGAGASWHYGYPTGADLIKKVIEFSDKLLRDLRDIPISVDIIDVNLLVNEHYPRKKLIEDCENISARLKQTNALVIDYFLEQNEDLRRIGKFLIAWVLIEDEIAYINFSKDGRVDYNKNIKSSNGENQKNQDWYRFIIYKLLSDIDVRNPSDLINKNNISFISFNYDVSLEYRLFTALNRVSFLESNSNYIKEFMETNGRFMHVYGQIRPMSQVLNIPTENQNGRDWYNKKRNILNAASSAGEGIRIIPELKNGNSAVLELAKSKIAEAERVFILGYGFDNQNNERIGLHQLSTGADNIFRRQVFFTNYQDKDAINKRVNNLFTLRKDRKEPFFYRGSQNLIEREVPYNGSTTGRLFYFDRSTQDVYTALESDFDFL